MGMRLHTTIKYEIVYGSSISKDLTDEIINLCYNLGWVSEDETELEIGFIELADLIEGTPQGELRDALQLIYDESDKNNDYARLSLF